MPATPPEPVAELGPDMRDMKLEEGASPRVEGDGAGSPQVQVKVKLEDVHPPTLSHIPAHIKSRSSSRTPPNTLLPDDPSPIAGAHEVLGGEIMLKMEPGKAPKLARSASQKIACRPLTLYLDAPDATDEAKGTFDVLPECTYANKHLGTTDPALECDCTEEWGKSRTRRPAQASSCVMYCTDGARRPQGPHQSRMWR